MKQDQLATWCGNYVNCYTFTVDGEMASTGEDPMMCDYIADAIRNSEIFEDVTKKAESFHSQLAYEVRHNGCKLYRVFHGNEEIIISYFRL